MSIYISILSSTTKLERVLAQQREKYNLHYALHNRRCVYPEHCRYKISLWDCLTDGAYHPAFSHHAKKCGFL